MVRAFTRMIEGVWIECTVCRIIKPWNEFNWDRTKRDHGKRTDCKECRRTKGHFQTPAEAQRDYQAYRKRCLVEAKILYGGEAFSYILFLESPQLSKIRVYDGFTRQAPKLRFLQHMGASHNDKIRHFVEAVRDEIAEQEIYEHTGISPYAGDVQMELAGMAHNQKVEHMPIMNVIPHPSAEAAALAEQAAYDRHIEIDTIEVVNKIRPRGKP